MNARVSSDTAALVRRGLLLEYLTITWSVLAAAVATVAGIVLTASALAVMALLGIAKKRTGARFGNAVLMAEARVILIDAGLAATLLVGLLLNAALGWWADPLGLAALAVNEAKKRCEASDLPRSLPRTRVNRLGSGKMGFTTIA